MSREYKCKDLVGQRFGHLVVEKQGEPYVSKSGKCRTTWVCKCDCGRRKQILGTNLSSGDTTSCGKCGIRARAEAKDLTGRRYGHLTVLEPVLGNPGRWRCRCDCGNELDVDELRFRQRSGLTCGKCHLVHDVRKPLDLTGVRFGHLTAVNRAEDRVSAGGNKSIVWDCVCDCGNHKLVTVAHLTSGHVSSCGQCGVYDQVEDLVGKKFGRLTVVARADDWYTYPNGNRDYKWICRCDCGNMTVTRGNTLKGKKFNQSCGCWRREESIRDEDMLGKRFGKCVVVSRADRIKVTDSASVDAWNCVCDCGREFVARGPQLRFGKVISCGCASTSRWEAWLGQFLDEHGVVYETQKWYADLYGVGDGHLTYDFCLHFGEKIVLVECQGNQHYEAVGWFGGEKTFQRQQEHDRRKRVYAKDHDLTLIELDCSDKSMNKEEYLALLMDTLGIYIHN